MLLGAAAAALGAVVVPGVTSVRASTATRVVVERADLGGRVAQALAAGAPVAGLFGGDDDARRPAGAPAPVERLEVRRRPTSRVERVAPVPGADRRRHDRRPRRRRWVAASRRRRISRWSRRSPPRWAPRSRCSMPIADDYGWVAKERYIGRSGQHIAPRLYLGARHLRGVPAPRRRPRREGRRRDQRGPGGPHLPARRLRDRGRPLRGGSRAPGGPGQVTGHEVRRRYSWLNGSTPSTTSSSSAAASRACPRPSRRPRTA